MSGFTMVTVSGQYLDPATGAPRAGTVTFQLAAALHNAGQSTDTTWTVSLNSSGEFALQLPATNDPGTTPIGPLPYQVTETLDGGTAGISYVLPVTTAVDAGGIRLGLMQRVTRADVTGSKASGAALTSLLAALTAQGLITDNTTA
jgi:hypothetical protein